MRIMRIIQPLALGVLVLAITPAVEPELTFAQSGGGGSGGGGGSSGGGSAGSAGGAGSSGGTGIGGSSTGTGTTAPSATAPLPPPTPSLPGAAGGTAAPGSTTLPGSTTVPGSSGTTALPGTGTGASSANPSMPVPADPQAARPDASTTQPSAGGQNGQNRGAGIGAPAQPQTQQYPPSSGGSSRTATDEDRRRGAAGKDVEECMKVWDPGTHMTKKEWRVTCERSLQSSPTVLIPELPRTDAVR